MFPEKLYKFEKFSTQSIRNLKNAQVFFNTPASFNDPFDCSVLEAAISLNDNNIVDIFKHYMKKKNIALDFEIKLSKDIPEKYVKQIQSGLKKGLKEKQRIWLHETGCTCFSSEMSNILMWSHYANGHKGFCLEFDSSFQPFKKAMKVNYSRSFPSIPPMKLFNFSDDSDNELLKPLLTKYKCWEYENEWRLFHKEPNKPFGYDVNALKAVYFGSESNKADIEIVCLILQGQCREIKFFKAQRDKSSYALNFEEFFYISHIGTKPSNSEEYRSP